VKKAALAASLCCLAALAASAKQPKPPKDPTPLGDAFTVSACTAAACHPERPAVAGSAVAAKRRAAAAPDGFVAAWQGGTPKDVHGISARFFKGASPTGAEFLASKVVPPDQYDVALAQTKNGSFVLVWSESTGSNSDIKARRFAPSGAALGEPFPVSVDAAGTPSPPLDLVPAVAATPGGGFVVVWANVVYFSPLGPGNPRILARRFDAAGAPLGPPFPVSTGLASGDPAVCVDAAGNVDVVWATVDHYRPFESNRVGVALRRFSSAGAPLKPEAAVVLPTSAVQTAPVVSCGSNSFVVAWQSNQPPAVAGTDILAQRYNKLGAKDGAVMLVNRDATTEFQESPAISHDASGNFVVVWQTRQSDKVGIFARRFSSAGAELSKVLAVASKPFGQIVGPAVGHTSTNGNFVVVWQDASAIRGRRYSP
jgi:hypothetical protein